MFGDPMVVYNVSRASFLEKTYSSFISHPCTLTTIQEKNRTDESEKAKMEKLIQFVREPLLEIQNNSGNKQSATTTTTTTT